MQFADVVRHRRMIRSYDLDRAVDPEALDRILETMRRAPSAGFSQGSAFLVLESPEDRHVFRDAVTPDEGAENWLAVTVSSPVLIVVLSNKDAYLDRYAQSDKGFTDRSDKWWTAPYWDIDAGMAAMLGLLACVDEGLGACFFGMEISRVETFRQAFGVPTSFHPIGIISLGHSSEPPRDLSSRRRPSTDQIHRGRWGSPAA
jgi:nitroreductase